MTRVHEVTADARHAGARLDVVLGESLGLSRARLKRLFEAGAVRVNGRVAKKGLTLNGGETLRVELPDEAPAVVVEAPAADAPSLNILFEDATVVVVDKPAGVPSHPLRPGERGTVANALLARFPEMADVADDPREAGLCHRLDVGTSGALLCARRRDAWLALREAFGARRVDKRYWAAVSGPLADEGRIELPLRHHGKGDRVEPAIDGGAEGRPALSEFRVLARHGAESLVEVHIITGVLHQVRAHLAAIGAPLLGDTRYGGPPIEGFQGFALHARSLGFPHPVEGRMVHVESALPSRLASLLSARSLLPDAP